MQLSATGGCGMVWSKASARIFAETRLPSASVDTKSNRHQGRFTLHQPPPPPSLQKRKTQGRSCTTTNPPKPLPAQNHPQSVSTTKKNLKKTGKACRQPIECSHSRDDLQKQQTHHCKYVKQRPPNTTDRKRACHGASLELAKLKV